MRLSALTDPTVRMSITKMSGLPKGTAGAPKDPEPETKRLIEIARALGKKSLSGGKAPVRLDDLDAVHCVTDIVTRAIKHPSRHDR